MGVPRSGAKTSMALITLEWSTIFVFRLDMFLITSHSEECLFTMRTFTLSVDFLSHFSTMVSPYMSS
jgi:hypothetical protein